MKTLEACLEAKSFLRFYLYNDLMQQKLSMERLMYGSDETNIPNILLVEE